jgi:PKD domain
MAVPHIRTSLLVAACALCAAAGLAPAASASLNVVVTIDASNGTQTTAVSQATVEREQDVAQKMTFTFADGTHTTGFETGLSLAGLAQLAGVDPARVTQATITTVEAASGASDLNTAVVGVDSSSGRNEITDGFFADPLGAPRFAIIQPTGIDGFDFVRPMRTATDDNADKILLTENNGDLGVAMTFSGEVLDVGAPDVAPLGVTVGDEVSYDARAATVTLDGANDHDALSYAWDFGDGSPYGHGASATHRYTTAGSWPVRVTVTDGSGAVGVTAPVTVRVKAATPATTTTTTTTTAPTTPGGGSPTGPAQGTPAGAATGTPGPLPAPGALTPPATGPAPSVPAQPHHATSRRSHADRHTTPKHHATTTGAATGGDTSGSSSTGDSASVSPSGPASGPVSTPAQTSPPATAPQHAPTGLVGLLIDAPGARAIALDHAASAQALPAARAASADDGPGGGNWASWTAGILAVLLVVGLGALVALEPRARYRSVATP